jgi:hypothetical protein
MDRLVPARAEQLCGRRAAEQRNELAASKFIEFHSIPSKQRALQDVELAKITQRACVPTRKLSCIVVAF